MQTFKKIGIGLVLMLASLGVLLISGGHKAYAAGISPSAWANAKYTITDNNTINVNVDSQNFIFTYNQFGGPVGSSGARYYQTQSSLQNIFCNNDSYIKIADGNFDLSKASIQGAVYADYNAQPSTIPPCQQYGKVNQPVSIAITVSKSTGSLAGNVCDPNQTAPTGYSCNCSSQGCVLGATGQTATGTGSDGNACEANNNTGLEWLICGVLRGVDDFVGKVNHFIDSQLNFNIKQNLEDPRGIKQAWSAFRVIASALLVLVMLVMVISQAVSAGPFDAYTVRKLLPRLVAAVILIQLSWFFSIWIIELANALGQGISGLLAAPFGGTDQLGFDKLMGQLGIAAPGVFIGTSLLGAAAAILINPFGALMLAFIVLIAVIVALAVLLIRQALIIACVIFLPVALVAWILPGTQRYFKLLWENFTKALLLFPIIAGLITLGRIFAWIVGTGGGTPGILDLFAIVIGFFGPYFLLPKAFRWGGTIMSTAGNAINGAIQPMTKAGKEGIRGLGDRYQGAAAKKYNPEDPSTFRRSIRRLQSGHAIPFSSRSQRLAIAAGDKWSAERDDEALALIKRKGETVMRDGYKTLLRTDDGRYAKYDRDAQGNIKEDANGKKIKLAVGSEAEAEVKNLEGVAAMKQMWVDLAQDGRDSNERKMAIRQLTATASWPEVQNSFTRDGKRVIDTDAWASAIATSPEDYPRVLRSRVDAAPHVVNIGDKAAVDAGFDRADNSVAARDYKSQARIRYAIGDQMSNEDFSTQSEGFWDEVNRTANLKDSDGKLTPLAVEIRSKLRDRFASIQSVGGNAPQQLLGHLVGGSVQEKVDAALGEGMSVTDYLQRGSQQRVAAAPTQMTPEGVLQVDHPDQPGRTIKPSSSSMSGGPGGAYIYEPKTGESTGGFTVEQKNEGDNPPTPPPDSPSTNQGS